MIILKTTDRGQLTIPKAWRDKMPAKYYLGELVGDQILLKPIPKDNKQLFHDQVESSWQEALNQETTTLDDLVAKYGL